MTLEALEAVAGAGGLDVFAAVTGLVEQSLLIHAGEPGGAPRFRMLETVREYAVERMTVSGEAEETRRRHAAWCLDLAERVARVSRGGFFGNLQDVAELDAEYANLRAALTWLTESGDTSAALRLAAALGGYWNLRGHMTDGRMWLERTLARDDGTRPGVRASALTWLAVLVAGERSFALLEEALALAGAAGDVIAVASATVVRGFAELYGRGDVARAAALGEEGLALFARAEVRWGITAARRLLAVAAQQSGDGDRAEALNEQLLADFRQNGGDEYHAAQTFHSLGSLAQAKGDNARALPFYLEALIRFNLLGDLGSVAWRLEGVAAACGPDHLVQAARLFAAADALRSAIVGPLPLAERPEYDRALAIVRGAMGEPAFDQAWLNGARLSVDAAIAETRAISAPH